MSLRFPASKVSNLAEFEAWLATERTVFDQRWLYEQQQIKAGLSGARDGTCGLCLAPTVFSSDGLERDRNWREEMLCGCERRLSNRHRGLLHYLRARAGLARRQQVALIGPETPIEGVLREWDARPIRLPRLVGGSLRCGDGVADHAICTDYLQFVPPLKTMLREIARIVRAYDTKSKPYNLPPAASDNAEPLHLFGWDLLDALRDLGFSDVAAHFYWSDEFGYLGPFNLVIGAVRL